MARRTDDRLFKLLWARLQRRFDPRIKGSVARRVTQKVALAVVGNRLAAWGPVHEAAMRLATGAESLPDDELHRLFEEITSVLLVGKVLPWQEVHRTVEEATDWYLARCICRESGRVSDLRRWGRDEVYLLGSEARCRPWLDRLLDARQASAGRDRVSAPALLELLDGLQRRRRAGEDGLTGAFFESSWPHFEILLDHPRYTGVWREAMLANHRAWRIHPDLLHAWVDLAWFTRGVVFTSMTLVDERYTICSCPAPENDSGCILFNWAWYSDNPYVLVPSVQQRRGEDGALLPCARFPARRSRPCCGCGCDHARPGSMVPAGMPDPRPEYDRSGS